jgi:chromosome segregation ATPase
LTDLAALVQRLDALDREQAAMRERLSQVEQERDRYRQLYQEMMERCRKLEKGLMGQQSESLGDGGAQLSLGVLELMFGNGAKAELDELAGEGRVREHTR